MDEPFPRPVMVLFDQWLGQRDTANARAGECAFADEETPALFPPANATLEIILTARATTLEEFAAKLVAVTDHGAYMDLAGIAGGAELIQEAAALVNRAEHLDDEAGCSS